MPSDGPVHVHDSARRQWVRTEYRNDIFAKLPLEYGGRPLFTDKLGTGNPLYILEQLVPLKGLTIGQQGLEKDIDSILALKAPCGPIEIAKNHISAAE